MKTLLAALLLASQVHAAEPLTTPQVLGEAAFIVLLAADHNQTRQIRNFCRGKGPECDMHEVNPLLGSHPKPARVRNYFVASAITHAVITYAMPSEYRAAWLASSIVFEAVVVGRNKRLGLRIAF